MVVVEALALILFVNLVFLALLWRLSTWYNLRKEGYWYHMACLNMAALLILTNEQVGYFRAYPFLLKVMVALTIAYLLLGFFKTRLISLVKGKDNNP